MRFSKYNKSSFINKYCCYNYKKPNGSKIKLTRCNDNFVGYFTINNGKIIKHDLWFCRNMRRANKSNINIQGNKFLNKPNTKTLVVLLESPHVDEFNKLMCNIAPAPALGATGCNLDKYFLELLNSKISACGVSDGEYNVILANAIQYQCSLGVDTEIYRDRVWLDLWLFKGFDKKLIARLKSYEPDVIINFCTEGLHLKDNLAPYGGKTVINKKYIDSINTKHSIVKTTLRNLVSTELRNNFRILILEGNHPSSWKQNPSNRTLK